VYEFALDKWECTADDPNDFQYITADFWRLSACSPFIEA
jgi:hypothetical protein